MCALSVPYLGPAERPFTEIFDEIFTKRGRFFYQAYFQKNNEPEAEAEANPRDFLRKFYYALSGDAPDGTWPTNKTSTSGSWTASSIRPRFRLATPADLDYSSRIHDRVFAGRQPFRNHERDFEYLRAFAGRKIAQPALFIGGTRDLAFNMLGRGDPISLMRTHVTDLRGGDVLEGCGHWTQQERPADVNARLLSWLKSL